MNPDLERFLNLRHWPATVSAAEAAGILGISPHEIPVLMSKGLLKPLGHPAPNAPKHFLTASLTDHDRDAQWHGKVRDALGERWRYKNGKRANRGEAEPTPQLAAQTNGRLA